MVLNISLDPRWHTVMPVYEHTVSLITEILSALAFYLMLTKTPRSGKSFAKYLMILQVFSFDYIVWYTSLPGKHNASGSQLWIRCLSNRSVSRAGRFMQRNYLQLVWLLGTRGNRLFIALFQNGNVLQSLIIFSVALVSISILYCFHLKYVMIGQMSGSDSPKVRLYLYCSHSNLGSSSYDFSINYFLFAHNSLCDAHWTLSKSRRRISYSEDGLENTLSTRSVKIQMSQLFPSMYYLIENSNYRAFVYDMSIFPEYIISFCAVALVVS